MRDARTVQRRSAGRARSSARQPATSACRCRNSPTSPRRAGTRPRRRQDGGCATGGPVAHLGGGRCPWRRGRSSAPAPARSPRPTRDMVASLPVRRMRQRLRRLPQPLPLRRTHLLTPHRQQAATSRPLAPRGVGPPEKAPPPPVLILFPGGEALSLRGNAGLGYLGSVPIMNLDTPPHRGEQVEHLALLALEPLISCQTDDRAPMPLGLLNGSGRLVQKRQRFSATRLLIRHEATIPRLIRSPQPPRCWNTTSTRRASSTQTTSTDRHARRSSFEGGLHRLRCCFPVQGLEADLADQGAGSCRLGGHPIRIGDRAPRHTRSLLATRLEREAQRAVEDRLVTDNRRTLTKL